MYFLQDKFRVRLPPPRDADGNPIRREPSPSSSAAPAHDPLSPHPPADVELVRDSFGLRKIIVVSTAAKKLIALDSETGFIIWRKFLSDLRPFEVPSGDIEKPTKCVSPLYVLRSAAHVPRSPLCLLVGKSASDGGVIFEFDPLTGQPAAGGEEHAVADLGYRIKQVSLLDGSFPRTSDHVRGVIILDDELDVHVHPPALAKKLVDRVTSHYVFAADASLGKIEGYAILPGNQLEWQAKRVWNVKIPEKLGKITAVVGRPPGEQTHSQGRVLADRSVMYKVEYVMNRFSFLVSKCLAWLVPSVDFCFSITEYVICIFLLFSLFSQSSVSQPKFGGHRGRRSGRFCQLRRHFLLSMLQRTSIHLLARRHYGSPRLHHHTQKVHGPREHRPLRELARLFLLESTLSSQRDRLYRTVRRQDSVEHHDLLFPRLAAR